MSIQYRSFQALSFCYGCGFTFQFKQDTYTPDKPADFLKWASEVRAHKIACIEEHARNYTAGVENAAGLYYKGLLN